VPAWIGSITWPGVLALVALLIFALVVVLSVLRQKSDRTIISVRWLGLYVDRRADAEDRDR
jgi:hypothetical protein